MGIPLVRGRDFTSADREGAPLTAIINESLARQSFANVDPIGHTIFTGMDRLEPMTIVGVVSDIHQYGPARPVHGQRSTRLICNIPILPPRCASLPRRLCLRKP